MLEYLNAGLQKFAPDWLAQRSFPLEMLSAVLDEGTGELIKYRKLMKKNCNLYRNYYAKDIG